MRPDIVAFLKRICGIYSLSAIYIPDAQGSNDVYSITTKNGHAISNFTTQIFYNLPPRERERMFLPMIKRGLTNLIGERSIDKTQQTIIPRKFGKKIC